MWINIVCHAWNKPSHIVKYCRSKNNDLVKKGKSNEKGKEKADEIRDQDKKMWVKKEYSNMKNGSTLESDDGTSFDN